MSFTWHTLPLDRPKVQEVDCFGTMEEVLAAMVEWAWEEPGNTLVDWVTGDERGEVVAVALFGPGMELIVTVSDGRVIRHPMPEKYRG